MDNLKEQLFLKNYDITKYDRPSIAADIAVFTVMEDNNDNYRKLPDKKLKLLLIKRGVPPYEGLWALPGGFVRRNETVENAAYRELREETGVVQAHLEQIQVFSEPNRDPRGWIISEAFMALTDASLLTVEANDDAKEASWFTISLTKTDSTKNHLENGMITEDEYLLKLTSDGMELSASFIDKVEVTDYHIESNVTIVDSSGLAFDHAKIILEAIRKLRKETEEGNIAFDLLPEFFTLTDLQKVYEIVLDTELLTANFRRKIANRVVPTERVIEGAGHRPAQLFTRNYEEFL